MIFSLLALAVLVPSRLQLGTNWSGEESLHYVSKEAEINETHRFSLSFRVTAKEDEMWVVERKSMLLNTLIDGTDIPGPPHQTPSLGKQWLSPAGFLLDADPYDKGSFGLDRLLHFWLPVNLPDEWSADLSSSTARISAKARADLKRVGSADGPSRQYSIVYRAVNEITATGTMWFDVKSGRLLLAKIDAKRAILPGGLDRADVTLSYTDSQVTKTLK